MEQENEQEKEFIKANFHLIETWSEFVRVSMANGETLEGMKKRLASNNLTEKQIDFILDPNSKYRYGNEKAAKKAGYIVAGIFQLLAGLFFLLWQSASVSGMLFGGLLVGGSFIWFGKSKGA